MSTLLWLRKPQLDGEDRHAGWKCTLHLGTPRRCNIEEAPFSEVKAACGESFAQFGDAAIVALSRVGSEGSDMPRGTRSLSKLDDVDGSAGDSTDSDYLKLTLREKELLTGLKTLKDAGSFSIIIVLLNGANQIEADFLDDGTYGIIPT